MIEYIDNYIITGVIGLLVGFLIARRYYQSLVKNASIGKIIEYSLINNKIVELETELRKLNQCIQNLKGIGEILGEQINTIQDIEKTYNDNLVNGKSEPIITIEDVTVVENTSNDEN